MKKPLLKVAFSTLTAALAVGMFFALGSKSKNPNEANAAGADAYWSTIDESKTDATLFGDIYNLIKTNTATGESGYRGLWDVYKTSDIVPGKSKIWDMYGGVQFTIQNQGVSSYSKVGDCYNREHSIPKSWWGKTEDVRYCDAIYLVPTDGYVNNRRGDHAFGEVNSISYSYSFDSQTDGSGNVIQTAGISKLGSAKSINGTSFPGGSNLVFEPDDQYKGDFARMYYYFANRYGPETKLALEGDGQYFFVNNSTKFYMTDYGKALMNKWHVQDPVSQKEINRNNAVETARKNRNPYIDHPEWADRFFGSNYAATHGDDDTPTLRINASSTTVSVGGSLTLTANYTNTIGTVGWSVEDSSTNVITLSASTGNSITVNGVAAGTKTVWATLGSLSASVTITVTSSGGGGGGGDSSGTATYTVDSKTSATLSGTAPSGSSLTFANSGSNGNDQMTSGVTETWTLKGYTGATITSLKADLKNNASRGSGTATLKNNNSSVGLKESSFSGLGGTYAEHELLNSSLVVNGDVVLTLTATANSFWCDYIKVTWQGEEEEEEEVTLSSISLNTDNVTKTFTVGDTFSYEGLVVTAHYSDESTEILSYGDYSVSSPDMSTSGQKTVTVTYGEKSASYNITVNAAARTLSSIAVSTAPTKVTYTEGEYFNPTGLVIRRNYSDSTYDTYTYANHTSEFGFTPSTSTALTTSNTSVTITYGGESCTQAITVNSSGGGGGEPDVKTDVLFAKGFGGYTTGSYSEVGVDYTAKANSTNATQSTYALQIFNGSTGLIRGNQSSASGNFSARNTTTYSGYYISSISLTVSGGTLDGSIEGRSVVYFGSSAYANPNTSAPSGTATTASPNSSGQATLTWTNTNNTYNYFILYNLKTSSNALSANASTALTITWTEASGTPTPTPTPTSITATVSKTYHPGDAISSSDLTVKDDLNNTITDFDFEDDGYMFTYDDANSGGASTSKTFTNSVSYNEMTCSVTAQVSRVNYVAPSEPATDTITASDLTATDTQYKNFSNVTDNSDARYAGQSAKNNGNIQLKSNGSTSGIVSTTSGGTITSVTITVGSGSNTINVYGKNTAYSSAADLYNSSTQDTLVGSTSSTRTITFATGYAYVGIRSNSGAVYLSSITINYGSEDTAVNVSNYIMYTDTTNQCKTKYSVAKGYFQGLSTAERATFMTSDDYVISTARERLEAWARYHGESISLSNGDYVVSKVSVLNPFINSTSNNTLVIIIIVSAISVSIIGAYFFVRRRKEI